MKEISAESEREIATEIGQGNKLSAVKIYQLATGASLMESKRAVEAMMQRGLYARPAGSDEAIQDEILDAIFENRKLMAVKLYKEQSRASLMESKEFIEALIEQLRGESPAQFEPDRFGCASALIVAVAMIAYALNL